MATTVQSLIDSALGRRSANSPRILADPTELIGVVTRRVQELYVLSSTVSPAFFGDVTTSLTPDGTKWTRPSNAIAVFEVRAAGGGAGSAALAAGTKIKLVDIQDEDAEDPPRVYLLGLSIYSVGQTGDPNPAASGDPLKVFFSKRHPALTATTDTLDSTWREDHNGILIDYLALHLAQKDGRDQEVASLTAQIDAKLVAFEAELKAFQLHHTRRWA